MTEQTDPKVGRLQAVPTDPNTPNYGQLGRILAAVLRKHGPTVLTSEEVNTVGGVSITPSEDGLSLTIGPVEN